MAKKKKQKKEKKIKVLAFMSNQHELTIVSESGHWFKKMEVDSEEKAKQELMSDVLNQQIAVSIGQTDFDIVFEKDPAGNEDIINACRIMEEIIEEKKVNEDSSVDESLNQTEQSSENSEFTVRTKDIIFKIQEGGQFVEIPGHLLKPDDICKFSGRETSSFDDKLFQVVSAPEKVSDVDQEDEWSINLVPYSEPSEETIVDENVNESETNERQFKNNKTKIIDVECAETYSEQKIKELGRRIRSLKADALQTAAEFREDIKKLERQFFDMCDGKSFTQMECNIAEDWENGVRRYIRPDTGTVALEETIPYEERQMKMDLPVSEENPESESDEERNEEQEIDESEVTDNTDEASDSKNIENEEDFPPPEETMETEGEPIEQE